MKLTGKVAIVTGASRGIGRAVALRFAAEGAAVVAVARNESLLDSLLTEISGKRGTAGKIAADVSVDSNCRDIIDQAISTFGQVDVLVNNAGLLGSRVEVTSIEPAEWREVFETNVTAPFVLSKYAAARMKENSSGSIINLTSGIVRHPQTKWGAYLPSKFAVEGLTLMLAEEMRESGVRVNMIDPGRTNTDMLHSAFPDIPRESYKLPDDIVEPFVFLASDDSRLVTGTRIRIR